jgi:hypothetical protein
MQIQPILDATDHGPAYDPVQSARSPGGYSLPSYALLTFEGEQL